MRNKIYIIFLVSILLSKYDNQDLTLSFYNFKLNQSNNSIVNSSSNDIFKPMLMSLFVPGLGQYKKGDKKKALLFFSIELLAVYFQNHYSNKTDQYVNYYENYANENWNFENWIMNYAYWDDETNYPNEYQAFSNDDGYLMPWNGHSHHIDFYIHNPPESFVGGAGLYRTNQDLFEIELYDLFFNTGEGFMEQYQVQIVRDHHFHEGIRKYNLFFAGWNDAVEEIQIRTLPSGYVIADSPMKQSYNSIWNKSIEFHDFAENAITVLYLNHIISMFDIYFKNKFDNKFNMKLTNQYNQNLNLLNHKISISVGIR